jgi:hypothetical protein
MRALGSQRSDAYWVNFVTSLSGVRIGVLPYERMDPAVLDDTPEVKLSFTLKRDFTLNQLADDSQYSTTQI